VDGALAQPLQYATWPKDHAFDGIVVREHGDDHITLADVRCLGGLARALFDQRVCLVRAAIVDDDLMAGLQQTIQLRLSTSSQALIGPARSVPASHSTPNGTA
jgi:hypothetical protein